VVSIGVKFLPTVLLDILLAYTMQPLSNVLVIYNIKSLRNLTNASHLVTVQAVHKVAKSVKVKSKAFACSQDLRRN